MQGADALMVATGSFLGFPALGNIDHHAAQLDRFIIFQDDAHDIPKPSDSSVGVEHAVFESMRLFFRGCLCAEIDRPLSILRMNVLCPEIGLLGPARLRVTQYLFRLI